MQPIYYSEEPDAPWRPWVSGNLDGRALKKRDPLAVSINGVSVHALHFGPADEWDCVVGRRTFAVPQEPAPQAPEPEEPPLPEIAADEAQEHAMRIWSGQSVSLGRAERVKRIRLALEAHGLSMDGVTLPQ